jgi:D-tyrosyl-tRNA(Tyr) deacylase
MRLVLQRVSQAAVSAEGEVVGEITAGLLVLVGITHGDTPEISTRLARKTAELRILRDGVRDDSAALTLNAPILVVSQFTLYGDTRSGRRPSWTEAAPAAVAEPLVQIFCEALRTLGLRVETGRFGATMSVSSVNDGPMTILLEA